MKVLSHPSPNVNNRPEGAAVTTLVLHYTGMKTSREALERMCDETAQVSAHYMVDEDGAVYRLVDEKKRAWHAGVSYWRGVENINDCSIGVEIVNPGHEFGYRPFPKPQMKAVLELSTDIVKRHGIAPCNVVAHSDIAPERKEDPGELFDWRMLAQAGVGLWVEAPAEMGTASLAFGSVGKEVLAMQERLAALGYRIKADGFFGAKTRLVVIAFQRHFIQTRLDGIWTRQEDSVLDRLLARIG